MSHPLTSVFRAAARGVYPAWAGETEPLPAPEGAAGVDPDWARARCPPRDLVAPVRGTFLGELAAVLHAEQGTLDLALAGSHLVGSPEISLVPGLHRILPACDGRCTSGETFPSTPRLNPVVCWPWDGAFAAVGSRGSRFTRKAGIEGLGARWRGPPQAPDSSRRNAVPAGRRRKCCLTARGTRGRVRSRMCRDPLQCKRESSAMTVACHKVGTVCSTFKGTETQSGLGGQRCKTASGTRYDKERPSPDISADELARDRGLPKMAPCRKG